MKDKKHIKKVQDLNRGDRFYFTSERNRKVFSFKQHNHRNRKGHFLTVVKDDKGKLRRVRPSRNVMWLRCEYVKTKNHYS